MSGGFSICFRTGGEADSYLELLLRSLNDARGTAFAAEPGTVAYVEDMAVARAMLGAAEAIRRLSLQFDPSTMTSFLDRWERILKIDPAASATDNERRRKVAAKFSVIGVAPFVQTTQDYLRALIGDLFVEIIRVPSDEAIATVPGGVSIPGGATILSGSWGSTVSSLPVRVVQPPQMSDSEFYSTVGNFKPFLYDFLPSYVTFDWGRYGQQIGTISLAEDGTTVTGSGTLFLTMDGGPVEPEEEIEVYADDGELLTLTVVSIESDTQLTVLPHNSAAVTDKVWKRFGFFLDTDNLDNEFLD